jgi:hypothetical protein
MSSGSKALLKRRRRSSTPYAKANADEQSRGQTKEGVYRQARARIDRRSCGRLEYDAGSGQLGVYGELAVT